MKKVRDIPVDPVGNESPSEPHAPAKDKSEAGREHNIASFPPPDKNAKIEVEEVNYWLYDVEYIKRLK